MTADLVFSLVDVVSIITLLGCIGFGLFRRDLVMFTACLGLIALTQSCASPGPGFALYSPMLHPQPIPNEEYSQEWFATYSLNAVAYLESAIKVDLHKSVFIGMFGMIVIASLFEGTAKNQHFNPSDAYSSPTRRQKFFKTRFFVGWVTFYTALILIIASVFANNWHLPLLDIWSAEDAQKIQSWILPASSRVIQVINASYFRELLLLFTLICYDQDAHTSISMAVVISFLPTLAISLASHALSILQHDSAMQLPSYLVLDEATLKFANFACLLAAHCIMYLSWIKTLHGWFAEQDLFKMRYNLLADKYQRDIAEAVATRPAVPQQPLPAVSEAQSVVAAPKASPSEAKPVARAPVDANRNTNNTLAPARRPANEPKAEPHGRPGTLRNTRSSFQDLVSGTRINLDSRGQSMESSSLLSVAQLKIGTPTLIPVDDGLECFSYVGKTIALWDLHTLTVKKTFLGHAEPVTKIKPVLLVANGVEARYLNGSLLPRVNLLISASWDGTIKLWNVESGECITTLTHDMGGITSINTYDNDSKIIAGSAQGKVALWDLNTHALVAEPFSLPPGTISAVGMWADQSKFFAASFDSCAYVWNVHTRKCENILKKHTKRILDAVLYDSDTRLITVSEDTLVIIWDLENGALLRTLEGHSTAVNVVAVYGDSQRAVTGSSDGQLIAWDIYTEDIGQIIVSSLDDHTAAIISIHVFEGDLYKMYTHSMDRKLRVWDMAANICERIIEMPLANAEPEVARTEMNRLNVVVAWNPADGPAIDSTAQVIQNQGHALTVCRSGQELQHQLTSSTEDFHFAIVDLTLPQFTEDQASDIMRLLNVQKTKVVLLITSDLTTDPHLSEIFELFKSAVGFLEVAEKPLTELSLAKMLVEVADSVPEEVSTSPSRGASRSNSHSSNDYAVIPRQGASYVTPNRAGRAESASDVQRLSDRLAYIESLFACFVPVEFFELISPKGRDRTQLGDAVCKSVTVLFSDIRDFSSMSETMAVSELMEFLNAYLAFAMPPIQENGGFVDKFIGDSIMALFSQDGTQQCISAVNCAISMMSHLDTLQDNGFTQVATGIGINTGRMIIGLVGVETRMEPTVLGDAVNLASRLESLCKVYDSRVIISQYTREKMGRSAELYTLRELDLVAVKGKKLACRIYEILEADRKESQKGKRMLLRDGLWDNALRTYRDGHWADALGLFEQCLQIWPMDKPSRLYIERCKTAINNGIDPRKWDSTNRLSFK